jgi:F420-non-reducing hydrogenase iron-sulfur subunit
MLDQFGIKRDRVRLEWVSASEGEKDIQTVENMTEKLRVHGPLELERE